MKTIRIGSGAGYSGDRIEPAVELAERGGLQYLGFECLAERTIALAQAERLRDPAGRDPMWGLVRVEAALPDAADAPALLTRRADAISRALLAEVAPLALPDARWDKMVYPIRDCEQFLKALSV